jgi:hypothetical protein
MMVEARTTLLAELQRQADEYTEAPPVVSLDDYFRGNTQEDSIAPNQVGYGRPDLASLYTRFREIQGRPEVQAVLVGLHWDWAEALEDGSLWPAAENVHIITCGSKDQVEAWTAGLEADGVVEGWAYGKHPSAPAPKPGFQIFSVCWD